MTMSSSASRTGDEAEGDGSRTPMHPVLLTQKLSVPRLAGPIMPRPRLFAALDAATRRRITTVLGPAGSGKTALLASWLAETRPDEPVTWVNLDPFDNDPGVFLGCLGTALHRAARGGDNGPVVPRARADDPVRELLDALFDLGRPHLLVLDNVHEVADPRVRHALERLLQRGPSTLRVVLSGRGAAGLRLGRLRLSGEVGEVTAAGLACTREEATGVLAALGVRPTADRLDSIMARTEGWLAGVRLLAVDAHGMPDYLREEVLDRQPARARALLLRTCLPERVGTDLAEELTGDAAAGSLLDRLATEHALVTAEGAGWFRYHPMLRETLGETLHRELPGEVAELRRRTAGWYARRGDTAEALRLAVAGADWEHAARLLAADELRLPFSGDRNLRRMLGGFPEARVTADPQLAVVFAAAELAAGDPAAAEPFLHLTEPSSTQAPAAPERTRHALRLCQACLRGEIDRTVVKAGWEMVHADGGGLELPSHRRGPALLGYHLAVATLLADEPAPARLAFAEALRLLDGTGYDRLALAARGWLALLTACAGRLTDAADIARLTAAEDRAAPAAATLARLATAMVELERGEPAAARRLLGAAADPEDPVVAVASGLVHARLLIEEGEPAAARVELDALRRHPPARAAWPRHAATLLHARALLAMAGPAEAAAVLDRALGEAAAPDAPEDAVVAGAVRLARDDPAAALRAVQRHVDVPAPDDAPLDEVDALVVAASAHRRLGNRREAVRLLERALDRAAPEGLTRVFVAGGADIQALLTLHVRPDGGHGATRQRLLHRFETGAAGGPGPARALLEPLTNSELAVLRYLPSLMVNEEIAAQMYLSVNTVKSHLRSLYRKLDVTNRRGAVARARRLGLL
jgi:LuxR family transcriptional regulator, maltose regulon positive regulatory protein